MHTGDIGFFDEAGWFYLVDRKKDMISASGFKVWPREVEDVLYAFPGVREAAVVGAPDLYRGETVVAFRLREPRRSHRCGRRFLASAANAWPLTSARWKFAWPRNYPKRRPGRSGAQCSGTKYATASGDCAWTSLRANGVRELTGRVRSFMAEHIYPNERRFYQRQKRSWTVGHPPCC